MLKFLRRYQTWIMAIGGSLLMVAFLLPQAIQRFGNMARDQDVIRLTIDGQTTTVSASAWQTASTELAMLESMLNSRDIGSNLNFPAYDSDDPASPGMHGTDHWILLKRAAQGAGLIGGPGDGDRQLQLKAAEIAAPQQIAPDDVYAQLVQMLGGKAKESNMTLDQGKQALATLEGIRRLLHEYTGSALPSDNRVRHLVRKFEDRLNMGFVFVDATDRIADEPEPTEDALLAQFEKYRDMEPDKNKAGFGYRLPDRVKVEYLTIAFQSLVRSIEPSGLEARKWYQRYGGRVPTNPDGSKRSFDEVTDDAINAYRRAMAEEKMTEISRFIRSELLIAIQPLPRDGMYRVLPEDWAEKRVSFETLREAIEKEFGVTVEYHGDTRDWTPVSDLASMVGIGGASRPAGAANMGFSQLVQANREISKTNIPGLQVGLADPGLLRRNDFSPGTVGPSSFPSDAFLYRVIKVDLARSPTSLDEVRAAVVKDLKRESAYAKLTADLDSWWRRGLDEGLDGLATSMGATVRRAGLSRYGIPTSSAGDFNPSPAAGIDTHTIVKAAYERAAKFPPLTKYSELPMEERLLVTPVPEHLGIAVIRLDSNFPPSRQRWLALLRPPGQAGGMRIMGDPSPNGSPLIEVVMREHFADKDLSPFSFESLKSRFNYVDLRDKSGRQTEEPANVGESRSEG